MAKQAEAERERRAKIKVIPGETGMTLYNNNLI
jgi:hypothetical protein